MSCSVFARILFFSSLLKLLDAQNGSIEIERLRVNNTNGKWTHQPDTFKIPTAMCPSEISAYCGVMGGQSVGGCTCECNSENTTFGFYDDKWKCTANSKVRQHGGCSLILLSNRTADSTLITVPWTLKADISYVMSTNHQRCYIIPYDSTYLLCDGAWKILENTRNFLFSWFSIAEHHNKQFFTFNRTKKDFWYNEVKGRVLRIKIGCYNKTNAIIRNCLLLKLEGTMKCPQFSLPPLPPKISPTSGRGTSTKEHRTHSAQTSSRSEQSTVESPSFVNKRKKDGAKEKDGANIWLSVGVVAGVIGLSLVIVTIVIFIRRRKQRQNEARESERNPQTAAKEVSIPVTNFVNQGNPVSDELEYEIMSNTETADESKAIKGREGTSETDSTMYCSLVGNVPHIYGFLKGHHNTLENDTEANIPVADYVNQGHPDKVEYEIMPSAETDETKVVKQKDTYQQLDIFGQQNPGEYQALNYPDKKM